MRENLTQGGSKGPDGRTYIDGDWYPCGIPANVQLASDVYMDTSYGFTAFHSELEQGMYVDKATGCYDRATFITGRKGRIRVGAFTILNGTTLISHRSITVGDHCMLAWGSVVTDTWLNNNPALTIEQRRQVLERIAHDPQRPMPQAGEPAPVVLEDNSWVGFDAVVLPGVRLGRSCLVGSKAIVSEDVPPYAIVAGNPARIIRYLEPDDNEEARQEAFREYLAP